METAPHISPPSIEPLYHINGEDMGKLEEHLRDNLETNVPLLKELASYLFASGGKRIRPLLTLSAAKLCGAHDDAPIELAAVIEFIHTATLLHDDVVDESTLRRGVKTANQVWTNKACILAGDYLFSRAFQMCVRSGCSASLKAISSTCSNLAQGEVAQLSQGRDISLSQEQYMEIITRKTACLFETACEIGAISSGASQEYIQAMSLYGLNLGIAFQLIDDFLDYSSQGQTLGKSVGDDFRDGSVTLPAILSIERADQTERDFWKRTLQDLNQDEGDLDSAIELMNQHGSLTQTFELAITYKDRAIDSLKCFPESSLKAALVEAAEFCVYRCF